jgi:hypothetical protein
LRSIGTEERPGEAVSAAVRDGQSGLLICPSRGDSCSVDCPFGGDGGMSPRRGYPVPSEGTGFYFFRFEKNSVPT